MNLNLFRTYVKVIETQNLSKTAEEFSVSQPAITKQIQALEEMYGVLLLERSGRKLKPTVAGDTLFQYAKEIVKAVDRMEKAMQEVSELRKGHLVLGASSVPGQYILPKMIKRFKDINPNISITMSIADTERIFTRVAEREIDIGIVGGWVNNRKVDGFKWLEDELVVIVPDNHKYANTIDLSIVDLMEEKWIVREKGSGTRKAIEDSLTNLSIKKEDIQIIMEAGSTEAVLAMVESGMGISIISKRATKKIEQHRKIKSINLIESEFKRNLYLVFPKQKTRRRSVNEFLNFITKAEELKKA